MPDRYLNAVEPGVYVLDPRLGPDTMAVLGAMASRAPDLARKIDRTFEQILAEEGLEEWTYMNPPGRIAKFIRDNVQGYGHASIASMAKAVWMLLEGFGWPMAWLLEDFPLYDGQEISTRAVDATQISGVSGPGTICRHAPSELAELHSRWLAAYSMVRDEASGGGWKYDDARVYLPGTVPTGVVLTQDTRAIARHLDHIRALGGACEALASMGYAALDRVSPIMSESIGRKSRRPLQNWRYDVGRLRVPLKEAGDGVMVTPWDFAQDSKHWRENWLSLLDQIEPRERASTYLDPLWRQAPRFHVSIPCSVAIARDWHRHRPVMPWRFTVLSDETGDIQMAPWYRMGERLEPTLVRDTSQAFLALRGNGDRRMPTSRDIDALHALPFGTLIRLEAVATLPDLVYMLELRYATQGANPEYKAQARRALQHLCDQLPREVVEAEKLDGVLRRDDISHPV